MLHEQAIFQHAPYIHTRLRSIAIPRRGNPLLIRTPVREEPRHQVLQSFLLDKDRENRAPCAVERAFDPCMTRAKSFASEVKVTVSRGLGEGGVEVFELARPKECKGAYTSRQRSRSPGALRERDVPPVYGSSVQLQANVSMS